MRSDNGPDGSGRWPTGARHVVVALVVLSILLGACSGSDGGSESGSASSATTAAVTTTRPGTTATAEGAPRRFEAEVWADNWFSLTVNGELVGEDSVPITTERSFNAETIQFEAAYPLTIAVVAKDFKEDDTGLEYIGTDRQQMGDGGLIAQITDLDTGEVVAVTGTDWRGLVIHRAPLDPACETSADPTADCTSEISAEREGWTTASFDDAAWVAATTYTAAEVGAKDGYAEISWDPAARLIWTSSLEQDNTVLWRHTVDA